MSDPLLLVVDQDPDGIESLERELRDRYGRQYRVECFGSAPEARERLHATADAGEHIALVIAAPELGDTSGIDLLRDVAHLHAQARRALLFAWNEQGDPVVGNAIFDALARGYIDHYLRRPSPPDEIFHHEISGLLAEWWDTQRDSPY